MGWKPLSKKPRIDKILVAQNADGNWGASVFEKETVLTERPEGTPSPALADSSAD